MSSEVSANPRARHVPELDGIRGVAIAAVMVMHFVATQLKTPQNAVERLIFSVTGYGMWGVDLFFVLSGYLITGILMDSRTSSHYFSAFYMRRTLRIFPLYYGVLFVLIVLLPRQLLARWAPEALQIRDVQLWLWPYLTNVYVAKAGSFAIPYISHFWSLAVEEHYYLFWPFVIRAISRRGSLAVAAIVSVFALGLRITLAACHANQMWGDVFTPCRLDALCIGAFVAIWIRGPGGETVLRGAGRILIAVAVAFAALKALPSGETAHLIALAIKQFLLAIAFGLFVGTAAWTGGWEPMRRLMRVRPLRELGKYSYGLYVFHGIVAYYFATHGVFEWFVSRLGSRLVALFVQALLGMALSALIAVVSFHAYEERFLRLKRWFKA
ncbi:MAG TPA: acyltransferase [Polyangiaceae bacterium]|nr:acyltransferase [Polyangiaceae bacterium]